LLHARPDQRNGVTREQRLHGPPAEIVTVCVIWFEPTELATINVTV
jgi:hypothetical protein